jgi:DNA-binding CsgD family transcriptional regulator
MDDTAPILEERARRLALLDGGRRLLQAMAHGEALRVVLADLCRLVEDVVTGCRCTVLLVNPSGPRMQHGAAPSLPESYTRALAGRPASAEFGPCGLAVARGEPVVVEDVATDERWTVDAWRGLALAHGLRACWSTPVLSSTGTCLAAFAVYGLAPGRPGPSHQEAIQQMTHIAAVAIERERAAADLRRDVSSADDERASSPDHEARRQGRGPRAPELEVLRRRYASLTRREREVMAWVVAGLPNKRIAAELGIAEITIKVHRGRVTRKMGADSLADLVRMATRLDVPLPA